MSDCCDIKSKEYLPQAFSESEISEIVTDLVDYVLQCKEDEEVLYDDEELDILFKEYEDKEAAYAYYSSIFKNSIGNRTVIDLICKLYSSYHTEINIGTEDVEEWYEPVIPLPPYQFSITVEDVFPVEVIDDLVRTILQFKNERSHLATIRMGNCPTMMILGYSILGEGDLLGGLPGTVRIIDGVEVTICFYRDLEFGVDYETDITSEFVFTRQHSQETFFLQSCLLDFFDLDCPCCHIIEHDYNHYRYRGQWVFIFPETWETPPDWDTWENPKKSWHSGGNLYIENPWHWRTFENQQILSDPFYPMPRSIAWEEPPGDQTWEVPDQTWFTKETLDAWRNPEQIRIPPGFGSRDPTKQIYERSDLYGLSGGYGFIDKKEVWTGASEGLYDWPTLDDFSLSDTKIEIVPIIHFEWQLRAQEYFEAPTNTDTEWSWYHYRFHAEYHPFSDLYWVEIVLDEYMLSNELCKPHADGVRTASRAQRKFIDLFTWHNIHPDFTWDASSIETWDTEEQLDESETFILGYSELGEDILNAEPMKYQRFLDYQWCLMPFNITDEQHWRTFQCQINLSDSFYPVYKDISTASHEGVGKAIVEDGFEIRDDADPWDTEAAIESWYANNGGYNRVPGSSVGLWDTPLEYGLSGGYGFVGNRIRLTFTLSDFELDGDILDDVEESGTYFENLPIICAFWYKRTLEHESVASVDYDKSYFRNREHFDYDDFFDNIYRPVCILDDTLLCGELVKPHMQPGALTIRTQSIKTPCLAWQHTHMWPYSEYDLNTPLPGVGGMEVKDSTDIGITLEEEEGLFTIRDGIESTFPDYANWDCVELPIAFPQHMKWHIFGTEGFYTGTSISWAMAKFHNLWVEVPDLIASMSKNRSYGTNIDLSGVISLIFSIGRFSAEVKQEVLKRWWLGEWYRDVTDTWADNDFKVSARGNHTRIAI